MTIPKTQTGYGIRIGDKEINKFEGLPVRDPEPGEILLKIEATGMCRSDHHILLAQNTTSEETMVMGHEVCGSVAKAGSAVQNDPKFKVGTRYSLFISDSCGSCYYCREGQDSHCSINQFKGYGISQDGGFQEYLIVRNLRNLVPIPDGVSYEAAASATDAILTPFHSIMKVKNELGPLTKVLVIGAGGLGLNAIQILKTFGCKIVCVDIKPENRKYVMELGAHEFYSTFNDVAEKHAYESFHVTFDFVGSQESIECCCDFVGALGKIVLVGMAKSKVLLPNFNLARREVQVIYNFGGNSSEQEEVLKWIEAGIIKPVVEVRPMNELPEYIKKLEKGQITGRIAFKPVAKL